MNSLLIELVRYGGASIVALMVDVACLLWLTQYLNTLWATAISFIVGGLVAYALAVRWVFVHRKVHDRRLEAGLFVALGAVGLTVNLGIIGWATQHAHWPLVPAKALAAVASFACNYMLRRYWLFSTPRPSMTVKLPGHQRG